MAFLNETFSVDTLPQSSNSFEVLPEGWYSATITQAELKTTSAGTGQYIKLRFDITGPTHQGRVVFGNLNIRNPNPKAEEIGRADLGSIMRAIGLASVQDTDQLVSGKLLLKVGLTKPQDGYEQKNEPKGYKALSGSSASFTTQGQPSHQSHTAQAVSATPPWAVNR